MEQTMNRFRTLELRNLCIKYNDGKRYRAIGEYDNQDIKSDNLKEIQNKSIPNHLIYDYSYGFTINNNYQLKKKVL